MDDDRITIIFLLGSFAILAVLCFVLPFKATIVFFRLLLAAFLGAAIGVIQYGMSNPVVGEWPRCSNDSERAYVELRAEFNEANEKIHSSLYVTLGFSAAPMLFIFMELSKINGDYRSNAMLCALVAVYLIFGIVAYVWGAKYFLPKYDISRADKCDEIPYGWLSSILIASLKRKYISYGAEIAYFVAIALLALFINTY